MAPDLTHPGNDAPMSLTRGIISYLGVIAACAGLAGLYYLAMTWLNARHAGFAVAMGASAAYGVAILVMVWAWSRSRAAGACMPPSAAARRYRRRQMAAAAAYVALLILAIAVHVRLHASGALAYAAAAAPAAPVIWMIAAMGLYLKEETDEFQRSIQVQSSLWATGGVLAIAAVWGFLEMFALAPHVEAWAVVPLWALLLGLAGLLTRRRYQ